MNFCEIYGIIVSSLLILLMIFYNFIPGDNNDEEIS